MRLELDPLGGNLPPGQDTNVPCDPPRRPQEATECEIRPDLPADPFTTAEGRFHHRSRMRLAQRVAELEAESDRKANVITHLADALARERARSTRHNGLDVTEVASLDAASRTATGSHTVIGTPTTLRVGRPHDWTDPDDGIVSCRRCRVLAGYWRGASCPTS